MVCTSARRRRGCSTAMRSAACARCIGVARSCLRRSSCRRRRARRRAGLGCTLRCSMRRCTRFWRCKRRVRGLRFLLYGAGCGCRRAAPCALRVRLSGRSRRKAAFLCCWRTLPASLLVRCKALHSRPAVASQIRGASALRDALYRVDWVALPSSPVCPPPRRLDWAWLGDAPEGLPAAPSSYADAWRAASVAFAGPSRAGAGGAGVHGKPRACERGHGLCRAPSHAPAAGCVARRAGDERLAHSRVVVVTRRAVATHAGEDVLDLARAPLWGLVRAAQSEHPGRLALLDIDTLPVSEQAWQCALGSEEPQLGCARTSSARRDWLGHGQTSCWYRRMALPGRCRSRAEARSTTWC